MPEEGRIGQMVDALQAVAEAQIRMKAKLEALLGG